MNYEIHITLEASNIDEFKKDCLEIGVKPIIIETQNANNKIGIQVMTSSKHSGYHYLFTLNELCGKLLEKNYNILRKKVEIQPEEEKHVEHIYYESHLRLKLPKDFEYNILYELCEEHNFHLSKNLFKKDENFIWQMITYRSKDTFDWFIWCIEIMKSNLKMAKIIFDKIEIEECIFDTNEGIDKSWLNEKETD